MPRMSCSARLEDMPRPCASDVPVIKGAPSRDFTEGIRGRHLRQKVRQVLIEQRLCQLALLTSAQRAPEVTPRRRGKMGAMEMGRGCMQGGKMGGTEMGNMQGG